jgi:hypothetical protein
MKARTKGDNLDRHFLAEVFVILDDVARIVEREVHHRRFVAVHLQDKAVLLIGMLGGFVLVTAPCAVFLSTRASDDGTSKSNAAIVAAAPAIFLSFVMEFLPIR